MSWDDLEMVLTIAGLTAITFVTRGFFLVPERELPMPAWLREGLRYAPIGALVAVVLPEIVMTQGRLISTWQDARLFGVAGATAWFVWRRSMLGTILAGTGTMLVFRLGLGW